MAGSIKKGEVRNPKGRPKGAQDKVQRNVKESVLKVYERLGGDAAFAKWARAEPTEFYKLYAKLLPKDVNATVEGSLTIKLVNEFE